MIINHNMSAMNAHRQMGINNNMQTKAMEKLSSGQRINRAGDDAAGLAISEKMRGQIRGLDQASRNAQDGISMIQTAEGALGETQNIIQRMRELAVQAGNDTNTTDDRKQIQQEINQLTNEVNRISNTTEFNTQKLIDGSAEGGFKLQIGANENQSMTIGINNMGSDALGITGKELEKTGSITAPGTTDKVNISYENNTTITLTAAESSGGASDGASITITIEKGNYTQEQLAAKITEEIGKDTTNASKFAEVTVDANGTIKVATGTAGTVADVTGSGVAKTEKLLNDNLVATIDGKDIVLAKKDDVLNYDKINEVLKVNGIDATIKETATAGTFEITGTDVKDLMINSVTDAGVKTAVIGTKTDVEGDYVNGITNGTDDKEIGSALDVTTHDAAKSAITKFDKAINTVSTERAKLGSFQNRLEHTIANVDTSAENLQAAESRVRDVDMAKEMLEFSKANILSQASQAMLAQAKQAPQGVLQLLR